MNITLPARANTERDPITNQATKNTATRRKEDPKKATTTKTTKATKTRKATSRTIHITKNTAKKEASTEDQNMVSRAVVDMAADMAAANTTRAIMRHCSIKEAFKCLI